MPAIDQSVELPIARYLQVRTANMPTLSPGATLFEGSFAYLDNTTGLPQLWLRSLAGGPPRQLTFGDQRVQAARFSPTLPLLCYTVDEGGNEHGQLRLLWTARPPLQLASELDLTRDPATIHVLGAWSPDGRRLAFTSNARNGVDFDVYGIDLDPWLTRGEQPGPARLLLRGEGMHEVVSFSPQGDRLLVTRSNSNLDSDLLLVDLTDGAATVLTEHGPSRTGGAAQSAAEPNSDQVAQTPWDSRLAEESPFGSPVWQPDGRGLWLSSNHGRDRHALATLAVADAARPLDERLTWLYAPEGEVEEVAGDGDGVLAFTVNVDGYSDLYLMRQGGEPRRVNSLPHGVYSELTWSAGRDFLALTVQGPRHNPDIWRVDPYDGTAERLTRSGIAGIPRERLVEPELRRYRSFDGQEVSGFLYRPARGSAPYPVIVSVHGGPEAQERPAWNPLYPFWLQHGYAVWAPNVRGSAGYGKRYVHLDDVRRRLDSVRDLAEGARALVDAGVADPQRLVVYGASYGGFMVLASLTHFPDVWAAGVDIVGIANFETFLENTGPWRRHLREIEYGSLQEDRDFFRAISPIHRVDRIKAPLFVIHGANDPRVPVSEAEQIVTSLRQRGMPVEYLRFEDEGHGLIRLPNRIRAYTRVVAWLDEQLGRPEQGPGVVHSGHAAIEN